MNGRSGFEKLREKNEKPEAMESVPDDVATEAPDRCGMSVGRGSLAGVDLELPNGDVWGVYYGAILGDVQYNPSKGVTFVFENAAGAWSVLIAGNNLRELQRDLKNMRRDSVRVSETGNGVTAITVEPYTPPAKPVAAKGRKPDAGADRERERDEEMPGR